MNSLIVKRAIRKRLKQVNLKIWQWMKPIYVVFRTPNPTMYKIVSSKIDVFPSVDRRTPTARELAIATKIAGTLCPGYRFNPENFVNERIGSAVSNLVYRPSQIPWSDDAGINELFNDRLELTRGMDKDLMVVGNIRFGFANLFVDGFLNMLI
jgi:hypothetical protein